MLLVREDKKNIQKICVIFVEICVKKKEMCDFEWDVRKNILQFAAQFEKDEFVFRY